MHLYVHWFQMLGESELEISLAKPPSESRQKEKRKREMMQRMCMAGPGGYALVYTVLALLACSSI